MPDKVTAPVAAREVPQSEVEKNRAFMDLLNDIERQFPVASWEIDGVQAWPVARIHLYYSFFDFQYFTEEPVRAGIFRPADAARVGRRIARSVWRHARASFDDRRLNQPIGPAYDLMFLNYQTYMTQLEGRWYSRICDPFVEHSTARGLASLMLTAGYEYATPRYSPSRFVQPQLVAHRLKGMCLSSTGSRAPFDLTAIEATARASGLFSDSFRLIEPIERQIRQIRGIATYFRRVLRQTRPRAVFVTCWYATETMACLLACHELAIPTLDIQHGTQGEFHVGYGRWADVPRSGYGLLPRLFWCWGASDAATINSWSRTCATHHAVAGGNLFLNRWIAGADAVVRGYDERLAHLKQRWPGYAHVLYTLNGSTKTELQTLGDIIEAVNVSGRRCHFWVRLHPIALDQRALVERALRARGLGNADVEHGTTLPLYAILRNVDLHLTEFSSVVIEAEAFGVPSVIGELGELIFPNQVAAGSAITARTTPEWLSALGHQLDRGKTPTSGATAPEEGRSVLDELLDGVMTPTGQRNAGMPSDAG